MIVTNTSDSTYTGVTLESNSLQDDYVYCCKDGLRALLGVDYFKKARVTLETHPGSICVSIRELEASSIKGSAKICNDHPRMFQRLLGVESRGFIREPFHFYVSIIE